MGSIAARARARTRRRGWEDGGTDDDDDALSVRAPQYIEEIDLGEPEGPRTILSGLVPYMSAEDIEGKSVIVFANLKVRGRERRAASEARRERETKYDVDRTRDD